MPKNRDTFVALDTSVYLHCDFFIEVDWAAVVGHAKVTLLVPMDVLRELDRHKDTHRFRKRRERARRVIGEINKALKHPESEFRDGMALRVYRALLTDQDFAQHSLDSGIPDERILAALLKFKSENVNSDLILVAHDGTMQVSASMSGLSVIEPPDSIQEPDEPDESESSARSISASWLSNTARSCPSLKRTGMSSRIRRS